MEGIPVMPNLTNRDRLEQEIAKAIVSALKGRAKELMKLLGNPPRLENVPPSFWQEIGEDLTREIRPKLTKVFRASSAGLMGAATVGIDWAIVNQAAVDWALRYTFELVKGINENSVNALRKFVSTFYEEKLTLDELADNISEIFGEYRAAMIAVTETTRATAQGEKETARLIEEGAGIHMKPIFHTEKDETVCEVCGPMDGKEISNESEYPPLHPNCRCYTTYEFAGKP